MASLTTEQADTFLRETRIAKLAYLQPDGTPTIVPIWFEWDGSVARMFTSITTRKARILAAEPRVALSVEEPVGADERWVTIEGTVSISAEGVVPLIERLARRYYEPAKAEGSIQHWTAHPENGIVLTLTPTKIRSLG